jgi:hypothetical protein
MRYHWHCPRTFASSVSVQTARHHEKRTNERESIEGGFSTFARDGAWEFAAISGFNLLG